MSDDPNIIQLGYGKYKPVSWEEFNIMIDHFCGDNSSLHNYIINYQPSEPMRLFIADIVTGVVRLPKQRPVNIREINTTGYRVLRLLGKGYNQQEAFEIISAERAGYSVERIQKITQRFKDNNPWSFVVNKQLRKTNPEVQAYIAERKNFKKGQK